MDEPIVLSGAVSTLLLVSVYLINFITLKEYKLFTKRAIIRRLSPLVVIIPLEFIRTQALCTNEYWLIAFKRLEASMILLFCLVITNVFFTLGSAIFPKRIRKNIIELGYYALFTMTFLVCIAQGIIAFDW